MAGIYSVSQVNAYLKNMFSQDFMLARIRVRGEVSNVTYHSSGHIYFTIKDAGGTLSAVMFSSQRKGLSFQMHEGQKIVASGSIEVYERAGVYQLYAVKIEEEGRGDLYAEFLKRKEKLEEMGMLQNGAVKVYAVDVGYGQLDWKLRNDPRVVCLEKTNIRYLTRETVPEKIELSSIDVSFISLSKVLPAVRSLLSEKGEIAALIKPQFEAGREKVGKHGVVRDKKVHAEVIRAACGYAADNGFRVRGLTFSPIRGPEGNIEYLYDLVPAGCGPEGSSPETAGSFHGPTDADILSLVEQAHAELDPKTR